jgi:hypothetical protein
VELTQSGVRPKAEVEQAVPAKTSLSDGKTGDTQLGEGQESAFVSASHEYALKQYEAASASEDTSTMAKAEQVAHSMGYSGRYDENPFDGKVQRELAQAFDIGERQKEFALEESRISKDDKEMDYDG